MKFGLEQPIIDKLIAVFEQNSKVDKALVFGSRAKGNYRPDSDIDIAIKGQDLNTDDIIAMIVAFEEKGITHKIDLINYYIIKEPDLKDHINRVGIELYCRWKKVKLGKFITVINGYAFKSTDFLDTEKPNSLPIIKIKNVANGDVNLDGVHHHLYSENLKKYVVENNDILIALTGNHPELETQVVGLVSKFKLDGKAFLNQRVAKLLSNNLEELNNDYLYYFLKNKDTHQYLASQSSGSANQANISKADIEKIPLLLPPLTEQTAIASILSSLDDKIDLLNRQNKTLEQLAETLFRQWFVEEGEKSWEAGTLNDEFDFIMGQSPLGSELNEDKIGTIFYQGRSDFGFRFPSPRVYTTAPTRLAKPLDTLISVRAPVGDMNMAFEECCLGRGVAAFRFKSNPSFYSYTYYKLRSLMQSIKQFEDNGSVFGSIGKDDFKKLENFIPPFILIEQYQKEAKSIDDKILLNEQQIRTLTQTRDNLLPKLMSGEVRVVL